MNELENSLARLQPSLEGFDRDRLMFLAGQASAAPSQASALGPWFWPGATAVSTLAAGLFGLLLAISHRPLVVREAVADHARTDARQATGGKTIFPPGYTFPVYVQPPATTTTGHEPPTPVVSDEINPHSAGQPDLASLRLALVDTVPRSTLPTANYVHQRDVALEFGIDALGSPILASREVASAPVRAFVTSLDRFE